MCARYAVTEGTGSPWVFRGVAESATGARRDVAIVRIRPELTRHQRFIEAALAQLRAAMLPNHPNVVEILDLARTPEGRLFVVGEYVEGCDLTALAARHRPLDLAHAARVMIACCDALAHAHARGVIHRDIAPRAILVSVAGEVKLGGFGLARLMMAPTPEEYPVPHGRLSYLPPEAAQGVAMDHRGDVFSAGAVLWELLAGRRLFLGDSDYSTMEQVRAARFVAIPGVDPMIDQVLRTALARDPAERYPTARAFGDALLDCAKQRGPADPGELSSCVLQTRLEISRTRRATAVDPEVMLEVARMTSIATAN